MEHSTKVPIGMTHEELGRKIAQMRYDALILVVKSMLHEFERQTKADWCKRRMSLVVQGSLLICGLSIALKALNKMLLISIPHMYKELEKERLLIVPED